MDPKEIQEIKDRAAREFQYDGWSQFQHEVQFGKTHLADTFKVIGRAIELASKREVKVPSVEELYTTFETTPKEGESELENSIRRLANVSKREGANWAIEKIRELNK